MYVFQYSTLTSLMKGIKAINELGVDHELQTEEMTIVADLETQEEYDTMKATLT